MGFAVKGLVARLVLLVLMALVPVLGFEVYTEYGARQIRQQLMEESALRLVRLVASEQQRIAEGAEQVLDVLAGAPAIQDNRPEPCQRLLANMLKETPRYVFVTVNGLDGHIRCAAGPVDPKIVASDRTFFRLALQTGGFVIGDYVFGRVTGRRTIHFAKPFRDGNGAVAGVVAVVLSLDWLGQDLASLPLPSGANAAITDRNGTLLAHVPDDASMIGEPILDANRFSLEGNEVAVAEMTSRDGRQRVVAYSPPGAEPKGLSITVGLDRDTSFAAVTRANRMGVILIIASAVLALLITTVLGRRLIRQPFHRLMAVADRWRTGDFASRANLRAGGSEFAHLAIALDAMAVAQEDRERALRATETELREAQRVGHLGSWRWDVATDAMTGSEETMRIYGLDPAMLPLSTPQRERLYPAESWRRLQEAVRQTLATGVGYELDIEAFRGTEPIWVTTRSEVLRDTEGRVTGLRGTVQDCTRRKRAEEALRQINETLEARVREEVAARDAAQARAAQAERMQALGQLAGGIAHDFNNILQMVEGAGSLIERRASDETAVRRLARVVMEAAGRGASITRRLLAFGRRADLRAEALDVAAVLVGMHEVFAHTLGAAIEVDVRPAGDVPPILADKGQLETALVNLAANARDAMVAGGRLTLTAESEIVPADGPRHPLGLAPGRYVRLTVADTGEGMDAATLARASEPFFTTKSVGAGTGLGLPMARGFAEQSGGALSISSSPGNGTTVTLWLPATEPAQLPAAAARDTEDGVAKAPDTTRPATRILLVDDEALMREVLAEQLEEAGYGVLVAASGDEALALLDAGEAVDVLVTDLSMPGLDGLAVIRGAQERRSRLPAVLLTGYAGDGASIALAGAITGSFSLLRKPIRLHDLMDRIQSLLAACGSAKAPPEGSPGRRQR
jgi:signal transduction histidine kinase/ActR/RegA family two-component response regulator